MRKRSARAGRWSSRWDRSLRVQMPDLGCWRERRLEREPDGCIVGVSIHVADYDRCRVRIHVL